MQQQLTHFPASRWERRTGDACCELDMRHGFKLPEQRIGCMDATHLIPMGGSRVFVFPGTPDEQIETAWTFRPE